MIYIIISVIGTIVRNYYLGNPFDPLTEGITIASVTVSSDVLNLVIEPFLAPITYCMVGMFYRSGDAPILGSILYMVMYMINNAVLYGMSVLGFHWWTNLLILVIYFFTIIKAAKLINE